MSSVSVWHRKEILEGYRMGVSLDYDSRDDERDVGNFYKWGGNERSETVSWVQSDMSLHYLIFFFWYSNEGHSLKLYTKIIGKKLAHVTLFFGSWDRCPVLCPWNFIRNNILFFLRTCGEPCTWCIVLVNDPKLYWCFPPLLFLIMRQGEATYTLISPASYNWIVKISCSLKQVVVVSTSIQACYYLSISSYILNLLIIKSLSWKFAILMLSSPLSEEAADLKFSNIFFSHQELRLILYSATDFVSNIFISSQLVDTCWNQKGNISSHGRPIVAKMNTVIDQSPKHHS